MLADRLKKLDSLKDSHSTMSLFFFFVFVIALIWSIFTGSDVVSHYANMVIVSVAPVYLILTSLASIYSILHYSLLKEITIDRYLNNFKEFSSDMFMGSSKDIIPSEKLNSTTYIIFTESLLRRLGKSYRNRIIFDIFMGLGTLVFILSIVLKSSEIVFDLNFSDIVHVIINWSYFISIVVLTFGLFMASHVIAQFKSYVNIVNKYSKFTPNGIADVILKSAKKGA